MIPSQNEKDYNFKIYFFQLRNRTENKVAALDVANLDLSILCPKSCQESSLYAESGIYPEHSPV